MPAGTPDGAVTWLHDHFRAAMSAAGWRAFVERAGVTDGYLDGPGFQAAMNGVLDAVSETVRG